MSDRSINVSVPSLKSWNDDNKKPVQFLNEEVFSYAAKEATGNAYQAVSQSAAQMIQNANTTFLNTEALVQATQAVIFKKLAEELGKPAPNAEKIAELQKAALWTKTFLSEMDKFVGEVGKTADEIVNNFPVGGGNGFSRKQQEDTP
jgi:hypothetical protein